MTYDTKTIYRGKELPYVDYFESKKADLTKEFLAQYPEFYTTDPLRDLPMLQNKITAALGSSSTPNSPWELLQIKGTYFGEPPYYGSQSIDESRAKFPTAMNIIDYFGPDVVRSISYSVLEPHSTIARHWDVENREGKFIRVHIPLIVPSGDLGIEVNGEIIEWSEPFAFNNLLLHSAWNFTNHRRLIIISDLKRSYLGLPDEPPWTEQTNANAVPFPKTPVYVKA
jgi:hypothetical protein